MKNLDDLIQELDRLPSENIPKTESLTLQSKGRAFESPRLHQFSGSLEELPLRDLLIALLGPEAVVKIVLALVHSNNAERLND